LAVINGLKRRCVQWQRPELLQRSDGWFRAMLPNATAYAAFQGYAGARWPKMVGPATTALMPAATGWYDASSVGNTSYSNASSPLLYWTGPSTTGPMLTVRLRWHGTGLFVLCRSQTVSQNARRARSGSSRTSSG